MDLSDNSGAVKVATGVSYGAHYESAYMESDYAATFSLPNCYLQIRPFPKRHAQHGYFSLVSLSGDLPYVLLSLLLCQQLLDT